MRDLRLSRDLVDLDLLDLQDLGLPVLDLVLALESGEPDCDLVLALALAEDPGRGDGAGLGELITLCYGWLTISRLLIVRYLVSAKQFCKFPQTLTLNVDRNRSCFLFPC